jgi:pimeloyl-ACP methyl ester carboxylesterase
MPDGTRQFAVYVAGTKLVAPRSEAFDLGSAAELEVGRRSASYDATLEALRKAGAERGDVVHAFGHSQGAMVTGHLALEGGYDVKTLVSLGSPIEVDVGPGTLSVALRHTDDPVAMMTGGGFDHVVGSPGSFVADRVADPNASPQDLGFPAHDASDYTETARMLDSSTDPRMAPVRELFTELGTAVSVEATEYSAERK